MSEEAEAIAARFHRGGAPTRESGEMYNAAPGQEQLTISNAEPAKTTLSTWVFVPEWGSRLHWLKG